MRHIRKANRRAVRVVSGRRRKIFTITLAVCPEANHRGVAGDSFDNFILNSYQNFKLTYGTTSAIVIDNVACHVRNTYIPHVPEKDSLSYSSFLNFIENAISIWKARVICKIAPN